MKSKDNCDCNKWACGWYGFCGAMLFIMLIGFVIDTDSLIIDVRKSWENRILIQTHLGDILYIQEYGEDGGEAGTEEHDSTILVTTSEQYTQADKDEGRDFSFHAREFKAIDSVDLMADLKNYSLVDKETYLVEAGSTITFKVIGHIDLWNKDLNN